MNAKLLFDQIVKQIERIYDRDEARSITYLLLGHAGITRNQILGNQSIEQPDKVFLENSIKKILKSQPVQYVIGETEFYGRKFYVDQSVLIPRPETEELIDWIVSDFKTISKKKEIVFPFNILDIGSGSGCIAVTLSAEIEKSTVLAIDISEKALETAKRNALFHQKNILFLQQDFLQEFDFTIKLDLIVSNPPYIGEEEKFAMHTNVLDFEPHEALFVPQEDVLVFYRKIAGFAKKYLKNDGFIYLELNALYPQETSLLFENSGFKTIEIKKDISGKSRMMKVGF